MGYFLSATHPKVSSCPQVMGLLEPLVQLYTGMEEEEEEVATFQATAHIRLIGMSTGTMSAIQSLLEKILSGI